MQEALVSVVHNCALIIDPIILQQLSYSNISCLRVFNEKTGLLEYTLLGLVSAGVYNVDIYTFIPNNEVT